MHNPFLSVQDGKFDLAVGDDHYQTVDPQDMFDHMVGNGITQFMNSSSVDFPEEYGMQRETVNKFWDLWEEKRAEAERMVERCLTPLIYRVERASAQRPADMRRKGAKQAQVVYRGTAPCAGAQWTSKDRSWHLTLHSLSCLQDLQKEAGCPVSLLDGTLTIQDEV